MPTTINPKELARQIESFQKTAERFSEEKPNLIEKYPERWVAVYEGEVIADAETMGELLDKVDKIGKPRSEILMRFLTRKPRTMILSQE